MSHYEKVYIDDLENEPSLSKCSDEAKWLWVRMFLYTGTKSPVRGKLIWPDGSVPDVLGLARYFGVDVRRMSRMVSELDRAKVFDRDERGAIVCRRQWREAQVSEKRRQAAERRWSTSGKNAAPEAVSEAPICITKTDARPHANSGIWLMEYSGSSLEEERVQREEEQTLQPVNPDDVIVPDAFGCEVLRELWNIHCGSLPKQRRMEAADTRAVVRVIRHGPPHCRERAWWIELFTRASQAQFKRWGVKVITLTWLLSKDEHIAALMAGEYDFAGHAVGSLTAAEAAMQRALDTAAENLPGSPFDALDVTDARPLPSGSATIGELRGRARTQL